MPNLCHSCKISVIFVDKSIVFWLFARQIEANSPALGIYLNKSQIFFNFFTIILTWI